MDEDSTDDTVVYTCAARWTYPRINGARESTDGLGSSNVGLRSYGKTPVRSVNKINHE